MKERIKEILCVVLLVLFIVFISSESKISTKSADEVFEGVKSSMDLSALSKQKSKKFEEELSLSADKYEDIIYYASASVMEVRELLIVKLRDTADKDELISAAEKRAEEKTKLFEGYAPKEGALLKNHVLLEKNGFVLFAVCDEPLKVSAAFKSIV